MVADLLMRATAKGIPLEEMGKLFGDADETMMYREDSTADGIQQREEKLSNGDSDGARDVEKADGAKHDESLK